MSSEQLIAEVATGSRGSNGNGFAPIVDIGDKKVGAKHPCYIIAEIGINHNGDLSLCKQMIDAAVAAGCDAVKFQKRTPDLCVPKEFRNVIRETPWGVMTYLEYRYRVEFGKDQYHEIARYCIEKGVQWFASVWDEPSIDFMEQFDPPAYKVPSAHLTSSGLLRRLRSLGRPVILSTGMSTLEEVDRAVEVIGTEKLILCHAVSTYPAKDDELNLKVIEAFRNRYPCVIGYSGHEQGLHCSLAAVVLGAKLVERHLTTDRTLWGTDQAASLEPKGMQILVRDIRSIESAMGNGKKECLPSELPVRKKLRGV